MTNNNLQAFLNPVTPENEEIVISKRFKDEKGNPIPFIIRPITQEENSALLRKFTRRGKDGKEEFQSAEYSAQLAAETVVYPDLKNAELQKAYGVIGERKLLQKMLLVGEYNRLLEAAQRISGMDVDDDELVDEAKNALSEAM